jgi:hypothetical protein
MTNKIAIWAVALLLGSGLVGCAGQTSYTFETDAVKFTAKNTKDYESFSVDAAKTKEGWIFRLEEHGVSASTKNKAGEIVSDVLDAVPSLIK